MNRILALALLAAAAASAPAPARAELQNCKNIVALPAVIAAPGVYCLKQNLATTMASGTAIDIRANNVTLDCNGFKVGGLGAGKTTQAIGVMSLDRNNVTVRNCGVRGFWIGIALSHGATTPVGGIVEDNRLDKNTRTGLWISGDGSVARRNSIAFTGGAAGENAIGIETHYSVDLIDNTIDLVQEDYEGMSPLNPYGIVAWSNVGGTIAGNRVRNIIPSLGSPSGIFLAYDSTGVTLRDNVVRNPDGAYGASIVCAGENGPSNVAIGNAMLNMTGVSNCTDGGGNATNY